LLAAGYPLFNGGLTEAGKLERAFPQCIFVPERGNKTTKQQHIEMKTLIITFAIFFGLIVKANAQNASASATQSASLNLSNAIAITFTGTGSTTGSTVNMSFSNLTDFLTGITSTAQQLKVQSNLPFNVAVKADASSFLYVGLGSVNINLLPTNMYQAKITANSTGGSVASPFSTTAFANLTANDQNIITNGSNGSNQTFSVAYKCIPGLLLPAGVYTQNVVYTATQL
jgi:hypothetical protein